MLKYCNQDGEEQKERAVTHVRCRIDRPSWKNEQKSCSSSPKDAYLKNEEKAIHFPTRSASCSYHYHPNCLGRLVGVGVWSYLLALAHILSLISFIAASISHTCSFFLLPLLICRCRRCRPTQSSSLPSYLCRHDRRWKRTHYMAVAIALPLCFWHYNIWVGGKNL